jgi:hypothetical protein
VGARQNPAFRYFTNRVDARFTERAYRAALTDPILGLNLTIDSFEKLLRDRLVIRKMRDLVRDSAQVSERQIYERYEKQKITIGPGVFRCPYD